jgi:hypothetical protein
VGGVAVAALLLLLAGAASLYVRERRSAAEQNRLRVAADQAREAESVERTRASHSRDRARKAVNDMVALLNSTEAGGTQRASRRGGDVKDGANEPAVLLIDSVVTNYRAFLAEAPTEPMLKADLATYLERQARICVNYETLAGADAQHARAGAGAGERALARGLVAADPRPEYQVVLATALTSDGAASEREEVRHPRWEEAVALLPGRESQRRGRPAPRRRADAARGVAAPAAVVGQIRSGGRAVKRGDRAAQRRPRRRPDDRAVRSRLATAYERLAELRPETAIANVTRAIEALTDAVATYDRAIGATTTPADGSPANGSAVALGTPQRHGRVRGGQRRAPLRHAPDRAGGALRKAKTSPTPNSGRSARSSTASRWGTAAARPTLGTSFRCLRGARRVPAWPPARSTARATVPPHPHLQPRGPDDDAGRSGVEPADSVSRRTSRIQAAATEARNCVSNFGVHPDPSDNVEAALVRLRLANLEAEARMATAERTMTAARRVANDVANGAPAEAVRLAAILCDRAADAPPWRRRYVDEAAEVLESVALTRHVFEPESLATHPDLDRYPAVRAVLKKLPTTSPTTLPAVADASDTTTLARALARAEAYPGPRHDRRCPLGLPRPVAGGRLSRRARRRLLRLQEPPRRARDQARR